MPTRRISTNPRPAPSDDFAVIEDWLAANGIDEVVPEQPVIQVDSTSITYRAFKFENDQRGHDASKLLCSQLSVLQEDRVVPLTTPLDDEVRAAFARLEQADDEHRAYLLEQGRHAPMGRIDHLRAILDPPKGHRRELAKQG